MTTKAIIAGLLTIAALAAVPAGAEEHDVGSEVVDQPSPWGRIAEEYERLLNWPSAMADQHRASQGNPGSIAPFNYVLDREPDPAPSPRLSPSSCH